MDAPAPVSYLLGGDGLSGNGASLNYTLPLRSLFANLELGLWRTNPGEEGQSLGLGANPTFYPAGLGVTGDLPLARLWTSRAFGRASELELGASHTFGRADIGDRINLTGVDLTYRHFPSTFKRILLQGEAFWHHRHDVVGGTGGHTRSGYYTLLSYRPDQYLEYGLRWDNTRAPWPLPGGERALSLILTDRLTEVTLLRLQLKHGDRTTDIFLPARRGYNEAWLQFLWGAGAHTHPLQ